ncbi:hypothetical protein HK101_006041, partial [Irineochytrium annulatum]
MADQHQHHQLQQLARQLEQQQQLQHVAASDSPNSHGRMLSPTSSSNLNNGSNETSGSAVSVSVLAHPESPTPRIRLQELTHSGAPGPVVTAPQQGVPGTASAPPPNPADGTQSLDDPYRPSPNNPAGFILPYPTSTPTTNTTASAAMLATAHSLNLGNAPITFANPGDASAAAQAQAAQDRVNSAQTTNTAPFVLSSIGYPFPPPPPHMTYNPYIGVPYYAPRPPGPAGVGQPAGAPQYPHPMLFGHHPYVVASPTSAANPTGAPQLTQALPPGSTPQQPVGVQQQQHGRDDTATPNPDATSRRRRSAAGGAHDDPTPTPPPGQQHSLGTSRPRGGQFDPIWSEFDRSDRCNPKTKRHAATCRHCGERLEGRVEMLYRHICDRCTGVTGEVRRQWKVMQVERGRREEKRKVVSLGVLTNLGVGVVGSRGVGGGYTSASPIKQRSKRPKEEDSDDDDDDRSPSPTSAAPQKRHRALSDPHSVVVNLQRAPYRAPASSNAPTNPNHMSLLAAAASGFLLDDPSPSQQQRHPAAGRVSTQVLDTVTGEP